MERRLGSYTIQGEIGRGGMASVYRALQESLNRVVALKELDLSRLGSEPKALERFRLEARAAAALEHPNIVTIYDLWEENGKAYIAMELVDGVELKDVLLNLGSIESVSAVIIALDVGQALRHAHRHGMIHRDVKPGNIMLSAKGEVRLMDFGIVSVAGTGDITVAGQILGTPAYMAPEQIAGEDPSPGADLFSLGAVLYEMIAGRKPFSGANHVALIQNVLHGRPASLHELDPRVPESISSAVGRCLEKDPGNRYGSVEEFLTVLEMVMPLDRPDRAAVIQELVRSTREQERTRLHAGTRENDRTSPMVRAPGPDGGAVREADEYVLHSQPVSRGSAGESSLPEGQGAHNYELETDLPADLPPLNPDGAGSSAAEEPPPAAVTPTPLEFKEIPELGEKSGAYVEETTRTKRKHSGLWTVLVLLVLAAAAAAWLLTGGREEGQIVRQVASPRGPARISITAEPAGRVFMDDELMGNADPVLSLEVVPGLHRLTVRHPRFGSRKFIVELEPGQRKDIEVKFGDQ